MRRINEDWFSKVEFEEEELLLIHKIRQVRKKLNFSQKQLAEILGVERSYISKIEAGRSPLDYYTLWQLSKLVNLSVSEIVDPKHKMS